MSQEGKYHPTIRELSNRDARQESVHKWCAEAFGDAHAGDPATRGLRLLEEAIEAYQSATLGLPVDEIRATAHKLVDHVFNRVTGDLVQEIGGVGVTLLALCSSVGVSADYAELQEYCRVKSKPLAHFRQRQQTKKDAGFDLAELSRKHTTPKETA
ncbi:MAG TPA: hypothetical protein VJW20_20440 [Candidatus Angelobacter sp.]|nr:hypothetical protein [Candidatus Angelobacter sp.]